MFGFFKKMREEIESLKERVERLEGNNADNKKEGVTAQIILDEWLNGKENENE